MKKIFCLFFSVLILISSATCGKSENMDSSFGPSCGGYDENSENDLPDEDSGNGEKETYMIYLDVGAVSNLDYSLEVVFFSVEYGETIKLPIPYCKGYVFRYWSLKGKRFSDEIFTLRTDITLVAEWKETDWPDNF